MATPTKKKKETPNMQRTEYQGDFKFHPEDEFRTLEELQQDCREIEARIRKLEQEKRQ